MPPPRKFDHDEARRLHADGWSLNQLAAKFGVSATGIWRVLDPKHDAAMRESSRRCYASVCERCGTAVVSSRHAGKRAHSPDGRDLCRRCRGIEQRTSVRFDEHGRIVAVLCTLRDCANGERWQPPANYARGQRFPDLRRGGFHKVCRACNTKLKREWRRNNPEARKRENARRMDRYYARKTAA